jgi:hypothetical protein
MEDERSKTCSMNGKKRTACRVLMESHYETDNYEDLYVDGRIILK